MVLQSKTQFNKLNPLKFLSTGKLDEIKLKDPNPLFKIFSVAHEGLSKPKVLGEGHYEISWGRKAVQSVYDKIKTGLQCISGHTKDNLGRGEKTIGEIVGKGLETIGGILNSLVVVYFPEKNNSNYDVISMEADLLWDSNGRGRGIADVVTDVMRFALGNSKNSTPAFDGAIELGSIQCFENDDTSEKETQNKINGGKPMPTFQDVKQFISENKVFPSQLFDISDIIGKMEVKDGKIIFYGGDDKVNAVLNRQLPDLSQYEGKVKEKDVEIERLKKIEESYANDKKNFMRSTASTDVLEYAKKFNLSEKQIQWIQKNLDKYNPSDNKEESIKLFVEEMNSQYKRFEEILNPQIENQDFKPQQNKEEDYL